MSKIDTINAKLAANAKQVGAESHTGNILQAAKNATEVKKANTLTVLGSDVGAMTNGYQSLDNCPISQTDPSKLLNNALSGDTSSKLSQMMPSATAFPSTDPDAFKVRTLGAATTSMVAQVIQTNVFDSAGDLIGHDSASLGSLVPTVTLGADVTQSVNEVVSSLTGIVPPLEPITIVSLGGSAVDAIAGAMDKAKTSKASILARISVVAAETSKQAGGVGQDALKGSADMKKVMQEKDTLVGEVLGAVSAVEGLADTAAETAANSVGSALGGLQDKLETSVSDLTASIEDGMSNVLGGITKAVGEGLSNIVGQVADGLSDVVGSLQVLGEQLTGALRSAFAGAIGGLPLSDEKVSELTLLMQKGDDVSKTKAAVILAQAADPSPAMKKVIADAGDNASTVTGFKELVESKARAAGIPTAEVQKFSATQDKIEASLEAVTTTIAGSNVSEAGTFYKEEVDLAELAKRYKESSTKVFPYVNSKEELQLEIRKTTRDVSEIVVHATESYTNANIGSEEIHIRHIEAGHDGIQYHYVIRRDGTLQRGMPTDTPSTASAILGHDKNCIDVALVGGVNVPSEADYPLLNLSASSFTQAQMKTLEAVCESFYLKVSGGQVMGHNAIDRNSQDPYFDVVSYVENKFGKKSVYKDLLTETSLSLKDLITKRAV
jgi:N-acetylmuramoyl-L-alanine amidase